MKLVLASILVVALWASPMGKSGLATAADLIAIVGTGAWLYCMEDAR